MTDEELASAYVDAGVGLAGLRAVYDAGLTRAAEIAETQILIRGSYDRFAAAIDAEKEKN